MKNQSSVYKVIPVLFAFFVMGLVDLVGISTNYVKLDFKLTDTVANLLPVSLFLWFAILSIPTGLIMSELGRKKTVLVSMAVSLVALIIPLFVYSFPMMLVAFGLLGIGNTIIQVSLNPLLTNVVSSNKLTSSLTMGQFIKAIAAFLGPIIAGFAAKSFGDWKFVFLVYGVVTVISALWLIITQIPTEKSEQKAVSFTNTFALLKDNTILMLFIGIIFVVGIDVGMNTTVPKFLMERCGIPLEDAGLGTSLYFAARTAGSFIGALLLLKLSGKKFFIVSMLVAIPALAVMLIVNNMWAMLAMVFVVGFAIANLFSIIFSFALQKQPDRANEISGLLITGVAGGAIIMPIMGLTADATNQTGAMAVLSVLMAYLLYCALKTEEKRNN